MVGSVAERGPRGRGLREGAPGFLPQRIPFGAMVATAALLPAGSCWAVGPLCGGLKGFERPGEQGGQRPGSAQSAQRGRGGRRARDGLGHSGRDQAWHPRPLSTSRPRCQVLQLCPLPWTCQGPGRQPPPHLGSGGPGPQLPSSPKAWCPSTQPNSWFKTPGPVLFQDLRVQDLSPSSPRSQESSS